MPFFSDCDCIDNSDDEGQEMKEKLYPRVKVVVVGDGCVGKTSMLWAFTKNEFPKQYVPTVFENYSGLVSISGPQGRQQKKAQLSLWDTAGQEDFDRVRTMSYPYSDAILLAFSVDDPTSLLNCTERWAPELSEYCGDTPIVLVGTKIDLRSSDSLSSSVIIPSVKGLEAAQRIPNCVAYRECSAQTREGLSSVFAAVVSVGLGLRVDEDLLGRDMSDIGGRSVWRGSGNEEEDDESCVML